MLRTHRLNAAEIARALGGRRGGRARCPAHDDRSPSLALADSADGADRVLVFCHAGCSQAAVIAALKARGLWPGRDPAHAQRNRLIGGDPNTLISTERSKRNRAHARELWEESRPADGTLVELYLRSRGITMPMPTALRFHDLLHHRPSGTSWPAMVALIADSVTHEPLGLHRTFLSTDGSGKAPIEPNKMMLGVSRGGVVCLSNATDAVMVTEGIETALSALQACGVATWAALSANGLKALNLPPGINSLTIIADGDPTGEAAALAAARRLRSAVRAVRVVRAPPGLDLNGILQNQR